jgi:hypothetical protein
MDSEDMVWDLETVDWVMEVSEPVDWVMEDLEPVDWVMEVSDVE